jgi:F0F1-type ATP synthase assembly protein I
MIVFVLLGFAAGTLNLLRSAGLLAPSKFEQGRSDDGE